MSKVNGDFETIKGDWESYDEWWLADRDAERKFFYLAGRNAGLDEAAETALNYTTNNDNNQDAWTISNAMQGKRICKAILKLKEAGDDAKRD